MPSNTPMMIKVTSKKSSSEEKQEVHIQKSLSMFKILLGRVDTTTDELVPANLSENFVELVEEGSTKTSMQSFQQQLKKHTRLHQSNTGTVIHYKTDIPMGVINIPFVAVFLGGHFNAS